VMCNLRWDRWDRWYCTGFGASRWYRRVGPVGRVCAGRCCPRGSAILMVVPPVPPIGPTKSLQNCLQYHRSHQSHPVARLSCLGDEKRV
jgi:hypothetical protein